MGICRIRKERSVQRQSGRRFVASPECVRGAGRLDRPVRPFRHGETKSNTWKMTGRFITERARFYRCYFSFRRDEMGEPVGPSVQLRERILVTRQIFGLIVAVRFVLSEFDIFP